MFFVLFCGYSFQEARSLSALCGNCTVDLSRNSSTLALMNGLRLLIAIVLGAPCALVEGNESPAGAPAYPAYDRHARHHAVAGRMGMVVSREALATQAGVKVLKQGGNAVDAAVAVGFALAVTNPQAGNIGGGGFMLIHDARSEKTVAIDYREKAPQAATRDMFLDENGDVDTERSRSSYLAVGVPGTVAGFAMALEHFGTITLAEALAPAIELATKGFPVGRDLYTELLHYRDRLITSPEVAKGFFKETGEPVDPGTRLVSATLGRSLELIARKGPDAFYRGEIADQIVEEMRRNGGLITHQDLNDYRPVLRRPIRGTYRGYDVYSMPPPSSGGVHIMQLLNILEPFRLRGKGHNSAATIHLMAEAMKYAYADRSKHLGDSDFHPLPLGWLLSKDHALAIRSRIDPAKATPSTEILPGTPSEEGPSTTHFSVMDAHGNAVANTYTLNFPFGSRIYLPKGGFFLNNEMDDFSAKPGVPNAYGLIGGAFNAIEPEKRMLSSMSPTIVIREGRPMLVTGSRGGSRIITSALQVILNVIEHEMKPAAAVAAPRIHHQWLPDQLYVEGGISPDTRTLLEKMGHTVEESEALGTANTIVYARGHFYGVADSRRPDALAAGY